MARLTSRFFPAVAFLVLLPVWPAAGRELSALNVFDAALAKFESNRVALRQWQYHQTLTTQQLDSSGKIVASGTWQSIVRPGDPRPLEYTSEKMEGKLSFFKAGAEEEEAAPEKRAKRKKNSEPENNQVESAIDAVRKYRLRDRYVWKRLPDETVAGEEAYVVSFQPKPNQDTSSREERFFGLLAGRLWISRDDFSVVKAQGALQSPCSLFWIIARVTTFQFSYDLDLGSSANRLLRASKATAKTVVTFPFYSVRQKHWQTADRFEPRTPRR